MMTMDLNLKQIELTLKRRQMGRRVRTMRCTSAIRTYCSRNMDAEWLCVRSIETKRNCVPALNRKIWWRAPIAKLNWKKKQANITFSFLDSSLCSSTWSFSCLQSWTDSTHSKSNSLIRTSLTSSLLQWMQPKQTHDVFSERTTFQPSSPSEMMTMGNCERSFLKSRYSFTSTL